MTTTCHPRTNAWLSTMVNKRLQAEIEQAVANGLTPAGIIRHFAATQTGEHPLADAIVLASLAAKIAEIFE